MIRSSTILTVFVAGLMFAGSAEAGLNVAFDSPVSLGDDLYQYTVRLVADGDEDIAAAWDGTFSGVLNQVWYAGLVPTPTLQTANYLTLDQAARDSHFSFVDNDILTARSPSESATTLDGAFAITTAAQMLNRPLAQIVIPLDQSVDFEGVAANGTGVQYNISGTIQGGGLGVWYTCTTGAAGYSVGQPIQLSGSWGPADPEDPSALVFVVLKVDEDPEFPGSYSYETIQQSLDPDFTFTPTDTGRYMVCLGHPGIGWGGGATPGPMEFSVIPEPATLSLLLVGLAGLARRRR